MKTREWARLTLLSVTVLGVAAALACVPSAPAVPEQSGGVGDAPESVSVPATAVPFVLQQSEGGGRDGQKGARVVSRRRRLRQIRIVLRCNIQRRIGW